MTTKIKMTHTGAAVEIEIVEKGRPPKLFYFRPRDNAITIGVAAVEYVEENRSAL